MTVILVVNGPNLNLLGERKPDIYGKRTLYDVNERLRKKAEDNGLKVLCFQSNHEGDIIDFIHDHRRVASGLLINPGAFTHYSYALRDAIEAVDFPAVEIHISDISAREDFRSKSVIEPVCKAQISGEGISGYEKGLLQLIQTVEAEEKK